MTDAAYIRVAKKWASKPNVMAFPNKNQYGEQWDFIPSQFHPLMIDDILENGIYGHKTEKEAYLEMGKIIVALREELA